MRPSNFIFPSSLYRIVTYGVAIVCVLAIYSYPALRTRVVIGTNRLPVISAPDLGLYLSLSTLESQRPGFILNPYYRVEVPASGAGFLKFRLGPTLFGGLTRLLSGSLGRSLLVWNLLWWLFACVAAIWLFSRFLPNASIELVLAGFSMLMFFNFGGMKEEISAWLHLPSGINSFGDIGLPYIRPFSPQIALPLLLLYLGLQVIALQHRKLWAWATMAAVQLFACASFPYATLLMVGITAIASLHHVLTEKQESSWRVILGYGLCCAAVDTIFLLHGMPRFGASSPGDAPLIHFQAAVLPIQMGKLWLFIGVLCVIIATSRRLTPDMRWTLVGLGVANMLMLLGDAFVPGPPLFLTNHASYFEHVTIVLLLTFAVGARVPSANGGRRVFRSVCILATLFFCLNGVFLAESGYRKLLPTNHEQADIVNWFARGQVGRNDLVITQHDVCAWVPFLSTAPVLFCRNSQAMLTPQQNHDLQRVREAWYLYFMGKGSEWVNNIAADPANVHKFETYGMYGEVSSYHDQLRTRQVEHARSQLVPLLQHIESRDPVATAFLRQFPRIWVIDSRSAPVFAPARLSDYLDMLSEETSGNLVIWTATPK